MFVALIWTVYVIIGAAMCYVYLESRDVFHPLMFIGPMMMFMYAWMPMKLNDVGGLDGFFQRDQLEFVQWINVGGIACFVVGCLSAGCTLPRVRPPDLKFSPGTLVMGGALLGCIGVSAWVTAVIHGSGGDLTGYRGGWDDSGYIRDASLLLFPAFLLILAACFQEAFRPLYVFLMVFFITPSIIEAFFSARRGPTFMIVVMIGMGWYSNRRTRPSLIMTAAGGVTLGMLMLFLVSNRGNIFLGSDRELRTEDITAIVERPDTGNEFIYGTGTVLSAEQRKFFFWGRRYLAQILIRPIPRSVWPNKYEDFGVPQLDYNAGTGEGFEETLGWQGAVGSAPGVVADLWMEFRYLNMPVLFLLGRLYCKAWRKAQLVGGPWLAQYIILSALSLYFVMQTIEAVIFRLLILSFPMWSTWRAAVLWEKAHAVPKPARSHPVPASI